MNKPMLEIEVNKDTVSLKDAVKLIKRAYGQVVINVVDTEDFSLKCPMEKKPMCEYPICWIAVNNSHVVADSEYFNPKP